MYSPELETLDQLCGGDLTLAVVRQLFPSDSHFQQAVLAMLEARDVCMVCSEGNEASAWERISLLGDEKRWTEYRLSITTAGARRIASGL